MSPHHSIRHRRPARAQRGAIAIIVGLSLAAMVGMAGLAVDLGRLYVNKAELQAAADACALAASKELVCDTTAGACPAQFLLNAETAGIFAAGKNKKDLQGSTVVIAAADLKFHTAIGPNASYLSRTGGASAQSKFAMCTARSTGVVPWFMGATGLGAANSVSAIAVATLRSSSGTVCPSVPLGVCSNGAAPNFGYAVGQWISSNFTPGNGNNGDGLSGGFKWVDYTPNAGGNSEIRDGLVASGACPTPVNNGTSIDQPGQQQGAKSAYNTRFGIYPNGANAYTTATAPPDHTGYGYPTKGAANPAIAVGVSAFAAYMARQAAFFPYTDNQYGGSNVGNNLNITTAADHQQYGQNRRVVTLPVIACGNGNTNILGFVCTLLLNPMPNGAGPVYMEFRGAANLPGSPCVTMGGPGGPGSTGPLVSALVQ